MLHQYLPGIIPFSFEKGIIYLNEEEAIVPIWHSDLKHLMARINKDATIKWRSAVPGYIIGTAKWKDKAMAFYTPDWGYRNNADLRINQISVAVFNLSSGEKLQDKIIFKNREEIFVDPYIQNKPDGQFHQLLLRTSKHSGKPVHMAFGLKKQFEGQFATSKIATISINDDLDPLNSITINSESLQSNYLGSIVNGKGETFITWQKDDKMVVEKFDQTKKLAGRLEISFEYESPKPVIDLNIENDQSLLLGLMAKKENKPCFALLNFDFASHKVSVTDKIFNKDLAKTLRDKNKAQGEERAELDEMLSLKLVGLLQTKAKIIPLLEERYFTGSQGVSGMNIGSLIVLFYDRNLELLDNIAIAKKFMCWNKYYWEATLGVHIENDKLFFASNNGDRNRTRSSLLVTVDLNTMKAAQPYYKEKDNSPIEGAATLWFKNRFIVTEVLTGHIQKVNY